MKNFIIETFKIVAVALLIVIPVRYFLFQPFIVSGNSMEPNYSNGEYLIVDEISYRFRDPKRGEVIVFRYPEDPNHRHIKRIIGLPQETVIVENQEIKIIKNDKTTMTLDESHYLPSSNVIVEEFEIVLGQDEYFVLGDNRLVSFDSRRWGSLPRDHIIGKTFLKLFPFSNLSLAKVPSY